MNETNKPGIGSTTFTMILRDNYFDKGDHMNGQYLVTKVYDKVWWRRILRYFEFIGYTYKIDVKPLSEK